MSDDPLNREDVCLDNIPDEPERVSISADDASGIAEIYSNPDLEDILRALQDPEVQSILNDAPSPYESAPIPPAEDPINAPFEQPRQPCGNGLPACPPGQVCGPDGFCIDDPNANAVGNLTRAQLDAGPTSGIGADGQINVNGTTGTSSRRSVVIDPELEASRNLYEKTRFVREFDGSAEFKYFTAANKLKRLFLSQNSCIKYKHPDAQKIFTLSGLRNAAREMLQKLYQTESGDIAGYDLAKLAEQNYKILRSWTTKMFANTEYANTSLPANQFSNEWPIENTRIAVPTKFYQDYSQDISQTFFSWSTSEEGSPFDALDMESFGFVESEGSFVSPVDTDSVSISPYKFWSLVNIILWNVFFRQLGTEIGSVQVQSGKDESTNFVIGAKGSEIILNSTINPNMPFSGGTTVEEYLSIHENEPFFKKIKFYEQMMQGMTNFNMDWVDSPTVRGNPAANSVVMPKDFMGDRQLSYLSKTSPGNGSIGNVPCKVSDAGETISGIDPFRSVMRYNHFLLEGPTISSESKRQLRFKINSKDIGEEINYEQALFNVANNSIYPAKVSDDGLYYGNHVNTPSTGIRPDMPVYFEKVRDEELSAYGIKDSNYNQSIEVGDSFKPYMHPNSTWKYESGLLNSPEMHVDETNPLRDALTITKEVFKLVYFKAAHKKHILDADMNSIAHKGSIVNNKLKNEMFDSFNIQLNDLSELNNNNLATNLSDWMRGASSFGIGHMGPNTKDLGNSRNNIEDPNSRNYDLDSTCDVRNFHALNFNFRNWLYGFGVYPNFGEYREIRAVAMDPFAVAKSYDSDFYSAHFPLDYHPLRENNDSGGFSRFNPDGGDISYYSSFPTLSLLDIKYAQSEIINNLTPEEMEALEQAASSDDEYAQVNFVREKDKTRSDHVYSTNLFPVIPFYSPHDETPYLESDGLPYKNVSSHCMLDTGISKINQNRENLNLQYKSWPPSGEATSRMDSNFQYRMELFHSLNSVDNQGRRIIVRNGTDVLMPNRHSDGSTAKYGIGSFGQLAGQKTTGNFSAVGQALRNRNLASTVLGAPTEQGIPANIADSIDETVYYFLKAMGSHPLINPILEPPTSGKYAIFQDHYTEIPVFLNKKELKETFQIKTNDHFDIKGVYNYQDFRFKEQSDSLDTRRLPSPYIFRTEEIKNESSKDFGRQTEVISKDFTASSAGSQTSTTTVQLQRKAIRASRSSRRRRNTKEVQYRYVILDKTSKLSRGLIPENVADRSKHMFFDVDDKDFKETYAERTAYPMFVEMEFSAKQRTNDGLGIQLTNQTTSDGEDTSYLEKALQKLKDGGEYEPSLIVSKLEQRGLLDNSSQNSSENPNVLNYTAAQKEIRTKLARELYETSLESHRKTLVSSASGRMEGVDVSAVKSIDFAEWFSTMNADMEDAPSGTKAGASNSLGDLVFKFLNKQVFLKNMKDIINSKKRNMKEVFDGVPAYSETVAFKVTKYEIDPFSEEKIPDTETNFYFSNIDEEDIVKFFDSQVKYGRLYRYDMYRVVAIIGTKYAYLDVNTRQAIFDLTMKSSPCVNALTETEAIYLCAVNPILAAQLNIISYETTHEIYETLVDEQRTEQNVSFKTSGRTMLQVLLAGEGGSINDYYRGDSDVGTAMQKDLSNVINLIKTDPLFEANMRCKMFESSFNELLSPDDISQRDSQLPTIYAGLVSRPDIKIVEVLDRSRNIAVVDKPPVPPELKIDPLVNNRRNFIINLKTGLGDYFDKPIFLEDNDYLQFSISAFNQGIDGSLYDPLSINDEEYPMLNFKSDDKAATFEIFRIDYPPESWDDFFNSKIARINTKNGSAQFVETIEPDKDYYYTFRCEDVNGHVSNPSTMYKVRNVTIEQSVIFQKEVYNFPALPEKLITKKSFGRFLQVRPSMQHSRINVERAAAVDGDVVGRDINHYGSMTEYGATTSEDQAPWNKKFKIRLTSKSTGRQIEFNIDYQIAWTDGVRVAVVSAITNEKFESQDTREEVRSLLEKHNIVLIDPVRVDAVDGVEVAN